MNGIFWLLALPVARAARAWEVHLLLGDSQRAEYYVDALAARVAGTDAVVSLHEKLLLEPVVHGVAQRLGGTRSYDGDADKLVRAVETTSRRASESAAAGPRGSTRRDSTSRIRRRACGSGPLAAAAGPSRRSSSVPRTRVRSTPSSRRSAGRSRWRSLDPERDRLYARYR